MNFEQYRDRRTAPLKWHKFTIVFGLVIAGLCALLGLICILNVDVFVDAFDTTLAQMGMSGMVSIGGRTICYTIFGGTMAFLAIAILEFWLGRNFKMAYIVLVGISLALSALSTLISLFTAFDISQIITLGVVALQGIYYYKRLPLFAKDYEDPSDDDENEGQINYDQVNQ